MKLFELAPVQLKQPKIWHMTEKANMTSIADEGIMYPKTQMRGASYKDYRIHFFTRMTEEVIDDILGFIRFGGIDFDDEDLMDKRADVPVVILELDLQEMAEFDEQMEIDRKWFQDEAHDFGVWTPQIIPVSRAMKVVKTL